MIKQTHEPELRFDKAIKFLSSEYYNHPENFEGSFTATFEKNSDIFKKLLEIKKSKIKDDNKLIFINKMQILC